MEIFKLGMNIFNVLFILQLEFASEKPRELSLNGLEDNLF